jgi:hypothetical protein
VEADEDTWISRIYNTGSDANAQGLLVRSDATAAHNAAVMGVYADGGYKMLVKSTGNVGIGTLPVTHYTGYEALDIGNTLSLMSNNTSTNISTLTNNGYLNSNASNWVRKVADESTMYEQVSGQHRFKTAASGSAGGAITWSEALRIDASGNVGIGTQSPDANLHVYKASAGSITASSDAQLVVENSGVAAINLLSGASSHGQILFGDSGDADDGQFGYDQTNREFYFKTAGNSTKRLLIDSSGDVGIGTDSPVQTLDVDGSIGTRQVRHSIRPSLNLDFANSKELDSRITFYRDSIATYYDSKGILKYANVNEPRFDHDPVTGESKGLLIEEARTNISIATTLEVPLDFNNMYIQKHMEVAPDGTYSGHHVLASSGVSRHEVNIKYPGTATVVYTASVYVKPLGAVTWLSVSRAGSTDMVGFDLINITTNTPGGTASGTISDAGNGWRKITFTFTETSTGSTRSVYMSPGIGAPPSSVYSNLNGDGENGVALWGMQVEAAAFATSYIPSDTRFTSRSSTATYHDETGILRTAPVNGARYGYKYDGRKWVETGLILETASTNMLYHSTKGSDLYGDVLAAEAIWTITDSSTDVTAPDGSTRTTKGVSGTSGNSWYWKVSPFSYTNGTTYTHSAWVRTAAGTTGTIAMNVYPQTLANGGPAATSITATDEWQRVSVTFPYNSGLGSPYIGFVSPQYSRTFYFWGWQIEAHSGPTSYIKTLGSAVTRAADVASSVAYTREHDDAEFSDISDWYDSSGTLYVDFNMAGDTAGSFGNIVQLVEDTSIRTGILSTNASNSLTGLAYRAPDLIYPTIGALTYGTSMKVAKTTPDGTNFITSVNGATAVTTTASPIVNPTSMYIGKTISDNYNYTGTFSKIAYYPVKLSNAELVALTENN